MNNYIGDNLNAFRIGYGLSQDQVAEIAGVSQSVISSWENGRSIPRKSNIQKILNKYTELTFDDFFSEEVGYAQRSLGLSRQDQSWVDIPLYGSIAAGTPLEMIPVNDLYPAPKAMIDKYPHAFWLRISSDSMDLLFPIGSLVLVNPIEEIRVNGKPYALCVNGYDATVKIVDKLANGFKLSPRSTDPTYKPKIFDYDVPGTDMITVIGEVVYDMKPFDWSY